MIACIIDVEGAAGSVQCYRTVGGAEVSPRHLQRAAVEVQRTRCIAQIVVLFNRDHTRIQVCTAGIVTVA